MGIFTLGFVVFLIVGTPLGLEIEHVEVSILKHEVDDSGPDIRDSMGEGAIVTVLAILNMSREFRTEFCFIFLNMIQPFNSVVCQWAQIFVRTFISFIEIA